MKIIQQSSWLILAIVAFIAALSLGRHVHKSVVWKPLKMQKLRDESFLQNELTATNLLKSATSLVVKHSDNKNDVEQNQSVSSVRTNVTPPLKGPQKTMPREVIVEFRDKYINPWREANGKVACRGKDRMMLEDKLDEMLFEARYYSVRIGDIQSLSQYELEKLPGLDITQISNVDAMTMSSEEMRLELVQQATKERWRCLRRKVDTLLEDPDRVNARQNANDQKRRDDPIRMLRKHVRNAKKSCKKRGHPFILIEVLPYLIDALARVVFDAEDIGRCGCTGNHKPCHNGKVQLMANGGGFGFSMDRLDDNLGYNQPIVIVCGMCNKRVKPDSIPKLRPKPKPVISLIAHNQLTNTAWRVNVTVNKPEKDRTEEEKKHLHRWQQAYDSGRKGSAGRKKLLKEYRATVTEKYNQIRNGNRYCPHCTDQDGHPIEMDIGTNEKTPKFTHSNNPRQISPDRVNDLNPYYDANNYDFCCLACQSSGREARNVEAELIPLTREKRDQMVQYLRDLHSGKVRWATMGL